MGESQPMATKAAASRLRFAASRKAFSRADVESEVGGWKKLVNFASKCRSKSVG